MKNKRIFALPSHQTSDRTSGVDFARIIQPMKHLGEVEGFKSTIWNIRMKSEWPEVTKKHDAIYFSYLNSDWGFAAMGLMARKNGCKLIVDFDDALPIIKPDNPAYDVFKKGSKGITVVAAIANECDHITVTNEYLKNVLIHHFGIPHTKFTCIDNYIDLDLYSFRPPFKDTYNVNIVHFGSTTHFDDLVYPSFTRALERIMNEYPNVTFTTVGSFFSHFKMQYGQRYKQDFGSQDIYGWIRDKYPKVMADADIVIAPLIPDTYNKSKSGIKYLEYSAAKKPGVYQNVQQYQKYVKHGVNGYLAESETDWYQSLKKLIDDKVHRKEVGEAAFERIQSETIQGNIGKYVDLFAGILDKK